MNLRFARKKDAGQLARLHSASLADLPDSLEFALGAPYLEQYYRILSDEKGCVILCAENDDGNIVGFLSSTLDYAGEHRQALNQNRFFLLLASIPGILRNPKVLSKILKLRQRGRGEENKPTDCDQEAHLLFWCWDARDLTPAGPIELLQSSLAIFKSLGVNKVRLDVHERNGKIIKIHHLLGAKTIDKISSPDEGVTYVLEYVFDN
jgi:hypothetical protein